MDIPALPSDGLSKFRETDCSSYAPVLDWSMRMDGVIVCSSCRGIIILRLEKDTGEGLRWVHAAR